MTIDPKQLAVMLAHVAPDKLAYLDWQRRWCATARSDQLPPEDGWIECGFLAGRGFGKTRVGAEWLGRVAFEDPEALPRCVVAPTQADVRFTCFEGESGLVNVIPPECVANYNRTDLVLTLTNGATIRGFSAEKADRLRGPQHADAWCTPGDTLVYMADGTNKRVDEVRVGEHVMTRRGPRRVLMSGRSSNPNPQVRITYGALSLTATADHPIFTDRGWVPAGEVREGDALCAITAWSGAGSGGIATGTDITSGRIRSPNRSEQYACTAPFGSTTTGLYPQDITYTTSTTTSSTTTRQTFVSWPGASIAGIISTAVGSLTDSVLRPVALCDVYGMKPSIAPRSAQLAESNFSHVHGQGLPAVSVAVPVWSGGGWVLPALRNVLATCVAVFTSPSERPVGSALPSATRGIASSTRLAKALDRASIAVLSLRRSAQASGFVPKPALTKLVVTGAEKLQTRVPVYCLKVAGEPEYFANGVLVHNCDELAAWGKDAVDTWDMLQFGMRLGPKPRVVWTTTPKPVEIVRKLTTPSEGRIIVRGSTYDNKANLPDSFFKQLEQYEGTKIGRQELHGELLDPEEAGIVRRSWLNLWPASKPLPRFDWIIMSLDTAFTEASVDKKGDPDPSACGVWGVFHHKGMSHVMLLDCWEDHLGMPDLLRKVKRELNTSYGDDADQAVIKPMFGSSKPMTSGRKPDILLIEDKGSGISLRQMLERSGIQAYAYNPGRADKLSRLHIVSPVFAQRRVWLPESEKHPGKPRTWCEPLIAQLCSFAGEGSIKHDDHVDQTTQALRLCMDKGLISLTKPPKPAAPTKAPGKPVLNPYAA